MESAPEGEVEVETFHPNLIQVTYTGQNGEEATEELHGFGRQISDDFEEVEEYTLDDPEPATSSPRKPLSIDIISSGGANDNLDLNSNPQPCSLKIVNLIKEKDSLIILPSNDEFLKLTEKDNKAIAEIAVELESESEKQISSTSAASPSVEESPPILVAYRNFPDDLCDSSQPHSNSLTPHHCNEDSDYNKESPPLLSPEVMECSAEPDTTINSIAQPLHQDACVDKLEELVKPKKRKSKETNCSFSVTPHSSAEIQERVKNRHRKKTLSFSIGSPEPSQDNAKKAQVDLPSASEKKKPAKKAKVDLPSPSAPEKKKTKSRKAKSDKAIPSTETKYLEGLFIVERIVKKAIVYSRLFFYVKWLNYPTSMNTWEPSGNFSTELIQYYDKELDLTPAAEVLRCKKFQQTYGKPSVSTKRKKSSTKCGSPTSALPSATVSSADSVSLGCSETLPESGSTFEDKRVCEA